MNKPKGQVCKKFILQLSIFIIYISCRGNRCDVAAGYFCGLALPRDGWWQCKLELAEVPVFFWTYL